jgi:prepilin-type N-terminal cleavage/methylation domain-containing protein
MSAIGKRRPDGNIGVPCETGFTLIEALVVIAIAALVTSIAFPGIERSLDYWRFRSSLTAAEVALQEARALALRQRRSIRISINSAGHNISVAGGPAVMLAPSTNIAETSPAIDFYGDGSSSGGRIVLLGAQNRRATLVVSPDTGRIGALR